MIDFRYHLVSIVAIFLALSLGLLLGSTALAGPVQRGLNGLSKAEQRQINNLLQQRGQLQGQISSENQFALANAPAMLHDVLAGQRVALVLAPGAPGSVTSGVEQALCNWTRPSSTPAPPRVRSSARSPRSTPSPRA
jgi:hypothetical protein